MGDVGESWDEIQLEIAKYSTVITYDRLGLGNSDSAKTVRSIENLSEELNLFLEQENLEGPFILVGHSLGGFIVRKYQRDHPDSCWVNINRPNTRIPIRTFNGNQIN